MNEDLREIVERFMLDVTYPMYLRWWTSLRLDDCGQLVYRHAVINCTCGRSQSQAYDAWREQHPGDAKQHDLIREANKIWH